MAIPKKITKFLDNSKVKYEIIKHRTVYTAFDKSQTLKVKPRIIGKTLVVKLDKKLAFVLIPADKNLDKKGLKKIAKAKKVDASTSSASTLSSCRRVDFLKENQMKKIFKGIKIGATPPFGTLWKINTIVDKKLLLNPKIIINSGDYNFSIKVASGSFKKLIPDLILANISKKK